MDGEAGAQWSSAYPGPHRLDSCLSNKTFSSLLQLHITQTQEGNKINEILLV